MKYDIINFNKCLINGVQTLQKHWVKCMENVRDAQNVSEAHQAKGGVRMSNTQTNTGTKKYRNCSAPSIQR